MEGHMARMQVSTETSARLLQAQDLLDEAHRLRPGRARNELRQKAKAMRELANLDPQLARLDTQSTPGPDRPQRS